MLSATTRLVSSSTRVPIRSGRITNSGSEGIVKSRLPPVTTVPRSRGPLLASQPSGIESTKLITIGTTERRTWLSVSSMIVSRLFRVQFTGAAPPGRTRAGPRA